MKGKKSLLCLAVACLFGASFCLGIVVSPAAGVQVKEVLIGSLYATSGPLAPLGIELNNGVQMAIDEINESGGIKSLGGAKLRLIKGDDEGKPEVAISETEKLARDGVVAIIGGFQSASAFTGTQAAEKNKVPFITQGVADDITNRGYKYTFRPHAKGSWIARDTANYMLFLNKTAGTKDNKVAVLYEDTLYGQSTAKGLQTSAKETGLTICADLPYPAGFSDATPILTKLKYAQPNFVVAVSYISDAILILKGMRDMRIDADAFIGAGIGYSHPKILELGKTAEYLMNIESNHPDLKIKGLAEMARNYKARFNTDADGSTINQYAFVYLVKDALERAGSIDREKVRDALASADMKSGERGNITNSRFKFDATGQIDFHHMVKQLFIDESGVRYRSVYPAEIAAAKVIFPIPKWKDRK
ncbi:MAG: ABC transporter substrate-binding protein [Syntrophorhabdales bacterium]|jgi:branched-chain amino acid transport system substrate-binding protein